MDARALMRGTGLSQTGMQIDRRNVETTINCRRQNRAGEARHHKEANAMKWKEPSRVCY